MQLSQKAIDEFKIAWKESFGEDISDERARMEAIPLMQLAELAFDSYQDDLDRKRKLKEHPKGFHLTDGTYSCLLCHTSISGDSSWYDEYGQKCLNCQRALNQGVIPPEAFTDRDSRYLMWELKSKFGLHSATVRKMMRNGELKARIITSENGQPYEYVFMKAENESLHKNSLV
jgi:cytochrome c peroxidase